VEIRLLKAAQTELDEAFIYYEDQLRGLGYEFTDEIFSTLKRIKQNPTSWASFSKRTRRCLVHRFPYGIIYQISESENEILVVAIAHLHRKPQYWVKRLDK
jgi:plasmid stabilization system protein ParE